MFLVMKPSRYMPYDAERVWERNDAETSQSWLRGMAEDYVLHLEGRVKELAGQMAVQLAQEPAQTPAKPSEIPSQQPQQAVKIDASYGPNTVQREARKRKTEAKYKSWRKAYKQLKHEHPDKSDVWISRKIANMEIGEGSDPETVRKRMK